MDILLLLLRVGDIWQYMQGRRLGSGIGGGIWVMGHGHAYLKVLRSSKTDAKSIGLEYRFLVLATLALLLTKSLGIFSTSG